MHVIPHVRLPGLNFFVVVSRGLPAANTVIVGRRLLTAAPVVKAAAAVAERSRPPAPAPCSAGVKMGTRDAPTTYAAGTSRTVL